jgi:hypothetical protein
MSSLMATMYKSLAARDNEVLTDSPVGHRGHEDGWVAQLAAVEHQQVLEWHAA